MNTRKTIIIFTIVFLTMIFSTLSAHATWYTCKVNYVGATSTKVCVMLTDTKATPAFTNTWFLLAGNKVNEMLATALTAASLGTNILVNCAGTEPFDDVLGIYVAP